MSVPITGTQHPLPFERLSGQDFERLCLWLMAREGYKRIADYGARGGPDGGRDFEGWWEDRRVLFQCKRVKSLTAAGVRGEIEKLRGLPEARQPDALCFLISTDPTPKTLDAAQEAWWGEPKDCWFLSGRQLDERVRRYPEIVGTFFQTDPGGQGYTICIGGDVLQSPVLLGDGNTIVFQHGRYRVRPERYRCLAPHPGDDFVHRQELDTMIDWLAGGSWDDTKFSTLAITTALQGAGGFGKTTLAQALCHDTRVQAMFPGGVLWLVLGEGLDDVGRIRSILDGLRLWMDSNPPAFESAEAAGIYLREQLHGRRVLVVLDDVWQSSDVRPFQGLDVGSALLITTRNRDILPSGTQPLDVDEMEGSEAVQLLGAGLDGDSADFEPLACQLGEWPLLLKLANGQLRKRVRRGADVAKALQQVQNKLSNRGLKAFDRGNAQDRIDAVQLTMAAGFESGLLDADDQERYHSLAIFPEDTDIPLEVLVPYWALDLEEVVEVAERLFDLSLLQRFDEDTATIRLHDVFRHYLIDMQRDQFSTLNKRFLASHRPNSGHWADLGLLSKYLWRNLAHHLLGAGALKQLTKLLLDFEYLRSKLVAMDLNAVLADFSRIPSTPALEELADALRLAAHVLFEEPGQLAGQLLGRLLGTPNSSLQLLLHQSMKVPGLNPRRGTLTAPGGPLVRTLTGHSDWVLSLAILGNGRLVSASRDGTVRIWDTSTGVCKDVLEGHSSRVVLVKRIDANRFVSASKDGSLHIWGPNKRLYEQTLEGHSGSVTSVELIKEDSFVSASMDETVLHWDLKSGTCRKVCENQKGGLVALKSLDDGRLLLTASSSKICLWDIVSNALVREVAGKIASIAAVSAVGKGKVVAGYADGELLLWDLLSGTCTQICGPRFPSGKWTQLIVVDGDTLVAASTSGLLYTWNLTHTMSGSVLKGHTSGITHLEPLSNRRVVSTSLDSTTRIWDLNSRKCELVLEGHTSWVFAAEELADQQLVTYSADNTLRVWDVEAKRHKLEPASHDNEVFAFSALNKREFVSASKDGSIRVWDVRSGSCNKVMLDDKDPIVAVERGGDGRIVVVHSRSVRAWELKSGESTSLFDVETDAIVHGVHFGVFGSVNIKKMGERCVVIFAARTLLVLDISGETISKGRELARLETAALAVDIIDEQRVVSAHFDKTIRVWNVSSGECELVLSGHTSEALAVASLGRNRIISAAVDGVLKVWDSTSGECEQELTGHTSGIKELIVWDEGRVVSASRDSTIRVWDLKCGECEKILRGHSDGVRFIKRLDNERIASASRDGTLRVWDIFSGEVIASFTGEKAITALAVLEGDFLVAGDVGGQVHILELVE